MNLQKLKQAEKNFFETYPGGFEHPLMLEKARKHKPKKMAELAQGEFAVKNFNKPTEIVNSMVKVVNRSSMVSLFEKPKFRDFIRELPKHEQERLSAGLEAFLYGDQAIGFDLMLDVLRDGKLAKWSIVTACPFYVKPQSEVFIKPTTAKGVISFFELEGLVYKPAPSYEFYMAYRDMINDMKDAVDPLLAPDNAHFSGFLMMSLP